jgi:hypothetical protein
MGNIAPLKKNIGIITKLEITPKPSKEVIRAAITIPRLVQTKARKNIKVRSKNRWVKGIFILIRGAKAKTKSPSIKATVEPLKVLPSTMEVRGIGATRISLKKPNSLSQIMLMVDCIAAKIRFITIIPGKIK